MTNPLKGNFSTLWTTAPRDHHRCRAYPILRVTFRAAPSNSGRVAPRHTLTVNQWLHIVLTGPAPTNTKSIYDTVQTCHDRAYLDSRVLYTPLEYFDHFVPNILGYIFNGLKGRSARSTGGKDHEFEIESSVWSEICTERGDNMSNEGRQTITLYTTGTADSIFLITQYILTVVPRRIQWLHSSNHSFHSVRPLRR